MSQAKGNDTSDDEFQDAIANPEQVVPKTNEEIIEELIEKHNHIKLSAEEKACKAADEDDDGAAAYVEALEKQVVDEDTDDEEALIEMEKVLNEHEMILRKNHAERLKLQANDHFRSGEVKKAIETYSTALQICPTIHPKDRAILHSNRAAAKIKIDAKEGAIKDCTKAINLWPEYVRAILRRAKLYQDTDKLDEALKDYELVYKLDPGNHEAREAIVRLRQIIQERNEKLKQEMMGQLKDLGNMILKPFGLSTENFQMQKDPATGGYSINFNQKT